MRRTFLPRLESLDQAALRSLQEGKLRRQLARVAAGNEFYISHWRDHGVAVEKIGLLSDIQALPFVTKDDLLADQADAPPYGRRLGLSPFDVHEITLTSGTSGRAKELHAHSLADAHLRGQLTAVGWAWAGMVQGDIAVGHIGANNSASLWSIVRGAAAVGRIPYLVGHAGFDERLQMMESYGVDLMFAMPSALTALAKRCEELGIRPRTAFPRLRTVISAGESWPIEWAERMEEFWGIRIHEVYGSTQTNAAFGASCCELGAVNEGTRGHDHLFEWTTLYEIVDPVTGEATPPLERGELVLTHLDKEASPLIRFRTGDLVRWFPAGTCPCGRSLRSLESGTIGRTDDMLKIRGQNIWTSAIDSLVLAHAEVDEFQVVVSVNDRGRDTIDMRVALDPGVGEYAESFVQALGNELKSVTDLRFSIRLVNADAVPHFDSPDRKARRWTDSRIVGLRTSAKSLSG